MKKEILLVLACLLLLCGCRAEAAVSSAAGAEETAVQTAASPEADPAPVDYDCAALYLQVFEDLWNTDPGLNSGIRYISVDLSEAPGALSQEEIEEIAKTFAGAHGAEPLTLTHGELQAQGYLTDDGMNWEDGLLFSVDRSDPFGEALERDAFTAEKWRSGEGAYFFCGCTAVWSESGDFLDYHVGSEAIS